MNMRKLLWLVLLTYGWTIEAQIVESSCEAPDSVLAKYEKDAAFLSLKRQWVTGGVINSVFPDPVLKDSILNAMMAVYNANALSERNEVITLYDIHAAYQDQLQEFTIFLNPDYIENNSQVFDSLSTLSGNELLDAAIETYQLALIDLTWNGDSSLLEARIQPTTILDIDIIIEELASFQGIIGITKIASEVENDRDISYRSTTAYSELTYTYRWGNCASNCQFEHTWTFRIYPDCNVKLVSVLGDALAVTNLRHILSISLFPNPTPDQVSVNLIGPPQLGLHLQLYNAMGQLISISEMPVHSGLIELELSLSDLPIGVYFLSVTNGNSVLTEKLVKR